MSKLNRSLLTIVGLGWLSFIGLGLVIQYVFAAPNLVVLVERSYCPPQQWQKVIQTYTDLYNQHQQKRLKIEQVILFSDLGEETLPTLPTPEDLRKVNTYGRPNPQRQQDLTKAHPKSQLLKCL